MPLIGQTEYHYGEDVLMMPYTPGADVAAGEVVVLGAVLTGICHTKILANIMGALGIEGGVYKAVANGAIAIGAIVYWEDATNKITSTAGALKKCGIALTAAAADLDIIDFWHHNAI